MAFWNQNKLPAEYRNKTEDEIAAMLAAGATAQTDAQRLKTEKEAAEAAKTQLESQANAGRDAVERLKKLREAGLVDDDGNPVTRQEGGHRETNTQGPPSEAEWLTNPNDAFQRANATTAAVAMHGAIMSARLLAEQFIQRQGPVERRLWDKYSAEIQKGVDGLSPEMKILPQTWINQFTFVKGMHLSDVVKEAQGSGDAFFSETAQSTGGGLPGGNEEKNDKLTPEEEKVARRMGRTPEQYLAAKKNMKFGPALL